MKLKSKDGLEASGGRLLTFRFLLAIALVLGGIAWIIAYYWRVRPDGSPEIVGDLDRWNYVIGFGLFFLGLVVSAHPSTPLGRGNGVVVGMLFCFIAGLLWICAFYLLANDHLDAVPVFNDLQQSNLIVGIAFMAVGFAFATRWE
ncbi:cell division protein CrgA [Nocardioides sp. GY 10127]|uniref:cell division protein CrgA n=1 Tax=Nocardioides sp. GY 10127 TaxID=2569762 RepID=UPI0010A7BECB|nr:cell division protein CrgA [Nocardioides sp. GY 10127]TIC82777.1 cell division protein CrgA [Nocardioides sp. GY 10127]